MSVPRSNKFEPTKTNKNKALPIAAKAFVGQRLQKVTEEPYKYPLSTFRNVAHYITYKDVGGDMDVSTQYSIHGMVGVITLSINAYCFIYKDVGLIWILKNIVPAKDWAGATIPIKITDIL